MNFLNFLFSKNTFGLNPKTILFFWALCIFNFASAQEITKFKQDGLRLYKNKKYQPAIALLEAFNEKKNSDVEVVTALAESYYQVGKLKQAQAYSSKYFDLIKAPEAANILLAAKIAHAQHNFKEAIKLYKNYLRLARETENIRLGVANDIKRCASGLTLERQAERALVENFGERVNSQFSETSPLQSPTDDDKMYFASDKTDATGGLRNDLGFEDNNEGHYFFDIYSTTLENSDYAAPEKLDNILINSARHEFPVSITNKGKSFIFFRTLNLFSGDFLVDSFKTENEIRGLPPRISAPIKPENGDNALFFFSDSLVVFSARNDVNQRGLDLFYATLTNNVWSAPINLGDEVNTPFDETTPFLCNDGRTLYFSSNSTASIGGFDIFKSVFDTKTLKWSAPENLGRPINSAGDDEYFKLYKDGYKAYLASNRKDTGFGDFDLYNVVFKKLLSEVTASGDPFYKYAADANVASIDSSQLQPGILEFTISSLFYNTDEDILNTTNISRLRNALALLQNDPQARITLTIHCLQGEKTSLDLYFSIKRAEKLAKFLIDNGIKPEMIFLKSVGSEFPIAKSVFDDGKPNPSGDKLNQRVDITFANVDATKIKINYEKPVVSEFMLNAIGAKLTKHTDSLSYKIQVNASKRLFDNDILEKETGAMIETVGLDNVYQYSIGLFTRFAEANAALQKIKPSIKEAVIVPYIKGVRVQGENAKKFIKDYPDLKNYLKP